MENQFSSLTIESEVVHILQSNTYGTGLGLVVIGDIVIVLRGISRIKIVASCLQKEYRFVTFLHL